MTATDLVLDEHRNPDGTRPLEVGRASASLWPSYIDPQNGRDLECWTVRWAAMHNRPVPARCRVRITSGDHYLLWTEYDTREEPTGLRLAYCAACAVEQWTDWQVREVAP